MKVSTQLQINTARELLEGELRETRKKYMENELKKVKIKFKKDIEEYKKELIKEKKQKELIKRIKKRLSKKVGEGIIIDNIPSCKYGNPTEKEIKKADILEVAYSTEERDSKEIKEAKETINKFILELKLGTALMEDMNKLVEIIKKIK
jgi:hypothetical protein